MAKSQKRKNNQPEKAPRNNAPYLLAAPRLPIQLTLNALLNLLSSFQIRIYLLVQLNFSSENSVADLTGACPVKYIEDMERSEFNQSPYPEFNKSNA